MPSELETDIDCVEDDSNGMDVVALDVVSTLEEGTSVEVVLAIVDPVWDDSTAEVEDDDAKVSWEFPLFELDGAKVIIVAKEEEEEEEEVKERGADDDDVENDEDDVENDEDDVSEDEDEESWEEKGAVDETKAELEVKQKPEDADGSAVAEDVPDDSILWDDSISYVELEDVEEPDEIVGLIVETVEVETNEFVWVALTCSEADTVETSVIFSVVEETTELAKVIGYTLVVVYEIVLTTTLAGARVFV